MKQPLFEVFVFWTRTGQIVDQLGFSSWSYTDSVSWSSAGTMSVTVPLLGATKEGVMNRTALKSLATAMNSLSLCLVRNGRALFAGPVYTLSWSYKEVTLNCASISKVMDSRILIKNSYWGDPTNPAGNLYFEKSPRDLVIELISQGITGYRRDLPITLPAQTGDGGPGVQYLATDLATNAERIKEIVDQDDGPDVIIRADINADKTQVRWIMDVGNPELGVLIPDATWDYPNAIESITGDIDASEMVSTGYVPGDTSTAADGEARLIGVAVRDRGDPLPALERVDRTSVSSKNQTLLNSLALSYINVFDEPVQSWQITILPEKWPLLGEEWAIGDSVTFDIRDHPWIDDGQYVRRIVGISHTYDSMSLETVPLTESFA